MMDIKTAQDSKQTAEVIIAKALKDLEIETGLEVASIEIERSRIVRGYSTPDIESVKIVLVL